MRTPFRLPVGRARRPSRHRILFVSTGQPRFGDQGFVENLEKQLSQLRRPLVGPGCRARWDRERWRNGTRLHERDRGSLPPVGWGDRCIFDNPEGHFLMLYDGYVRQEYHCLEVIPL